MKKAAAILIILALLFTPAIAGTIYIWTDEDGVRRFSDKPPEGVEEYETAVVSRPNAPEGEREGLKKMLEEQEAQKIKDRAKDQEAEVARKAEQEQKAKAEQPDKVRDERERLQQKIEALRKRGLSSNFTEGMRQHQISEIQKQIDTLDRVK